MAVLERRKNITAHHRRALALLHLHLLRDWLEAKRLYVIISTNRSGALNVLARYLTEVTGVWWYVDLEEIVLAHGDGEDGAALPPWARTLMEWICDSSTQLTVVEILAMLVILERQQAA